MTETPKTTKEAEMTLHDKLIDIQQRLKVPKGRENDFGGFVYRSIEDIEDKVKPLLKEHGLVLTFDDQMVGIEGRVYVKATAEISDGKETIFVSAYAREAEKPKAKTDDAQLTGACSSYARKYAASGLFLIDNTADADSRVDGKTDTKRLMELSQAKTNLFKAFKEAGIDDSVIMMDTIQKATNKDAVETVADAEKVIEYIQKVV